MCSAGHPLLPVTMRGVRLVRSGTPVIEDLTFTTHIGERIALLGPNGAGKSLALRLLKGLEHPDSGEISWAGADVPPRLGVAIILQRTVMLRRSVAANLRHALKAVSVPRNGREAEIDALLEMAELTPLRNRPARALSGGEQQRLSVVRALAGAPSLLLLDEPTSSLDPRSTFIIERVIDHACNGKLSNAGVTTIWVTHDLAQARRVADRIVFLHRGRVIEQGTAGEFFARPRSPEATRFLAGELLL